MSLKPHPEYKDSGANWLGAVPTSWSISPLGHFFTERSQTVSDKDFQPLSVTMQGIVAQMENVAKTENGDKRKLVRRGDFVINSRSDRKGSSGVADRDGSVSVISIVLEPHGIVPQFVHHLLRSKPFQEEFYRFGTGIVADLWSTRFSSMKSIRLAVPSVIEQNAIARYLDRETAEIDAFIADQEELIVLLNERRAATITQTVTKGLDPTVQLKETGFAWLGSVPLSWQVTYLKHAVESLPGYAFKSEEFSTDEDDIRLLRGVNINPDRVVWGDVVRFDRNRAPEVAVYGLREGDLVLGLDRPIVTGGMRIASIEEADLPSFVLQRVARIRSNRRAVQGFVRYLLQSKVFQDYLAPVFTGVSVPHMSTGQLGEFGIGLPDPSVQLAIVSHLDAELAEIDATLLDAEESIVLSKERRAALISAAVTGKIDVRDTSAAKERLTEGELVVH